MKKDFESKLSELLDEQFKDTPYRSYDELIQILQSKINDLKAQKQNDGET